MPSKPLNKQYLKIELPKGFLAVQGGETLIEGVPKARVVGAIAAAVGTYMFVSILVQGFGALKNFATLSALSPGPLNKMFGIILTPQQADIKGPKEIAPILDVTDIEINAVAFGAGLATGGVVLAGLNPGEIIKGIGEIIKGVGEIIPG